MRNLTLVLVLLLASCAGGESLSAYSTLGTYNLVAANGRPSPYKATFVLAADGAFSGKAPCNTYSGQSTVPYPWFDGSKIAATKKACPQMASETRFLNAIESMTLAESLGDTLILSNDDFETLTFKLSTSN